MLNRKYRYLIALSREKHFGRAAASCNVSPSTLSAAISDLENEIGYAVVERGKQFSGFTPEGLLLLDYALRVSDSLTTLEQELSARRGKLTGHLRIGVIPTALTAIAFLSELFYKKYPEVTLEVLSHSTTDILNRLTKFELDAGIIYQGESYAESLTLTPLWQEPHVLITPATEQFKGRTSATWEEASKLRLCLLTPDMKNRQIIDSIFRAAGCEVHPHLETNAIVSILAHTTTGVWSSILPKSVIEMIGAPQGTVALPLTQPTRTWEIGLATLKRDPMPPILTALIDEAKHLNESFDKNEQSFDKIHFL